MTNQKGPLVVGGSAARMAGASPATADKLAKANVIGPRQWPQVQALFTQSEGKPSVAPESDKRPAMVTTADASDFDDVTGS